jgi:lysine-N-methylase
MKIRALPIIERWDCHRCTACCRETTIPLNADDLDRLAAQKWEQQPEFGGIRIKRRSVLLGGGWILAQKADGSCVFLTDDGRCRIHERFGPEAKPILCQMFPLQVVATDRDLYATVMRSCPSAAAGRGRPLAEHVGQLRRLLGNDAVAAAASTAPPVVRRANRNWDNFYLVADAVARLLVDGRFPLVRRVIHALRFCSLLDQCRWNRLEADSIPQLIDVLEQSASQNVGPLFEDRQPPTPRTSRLFRRLGSHFIRCYPGGRPTRGLVDHWRVFRLSSRLARAGEQAPEIDSRFPAIEISRLDRRLGPLAGEVLRPLEQFFESHATSKRYAIARHGAALADSVRCLAFTFPVSLWMLRWLASERDPRAEDMVQIVVALERGLELRALGHAARFLAESDQLERLVAWYSR